MVPYSNEFLRILNNPVGFEIHIKLEISDHLGNFLGEYSQQVMRDMGSINLTSESPARRSLSLTLDNSTGEFIFNENSLIWLNKRIKLYIGIKRGNQPIEYLPQGVYVLTQPSNDNTLETGQRTIIELVDKSFLYTDARGKLLNYLELVEGLPITEAIKIVAQGAYETQFNFDDMTETIPYVLNYQPDTSRWQIIQDLADLAKCHVYFDYNGYLTLKKIDLNQIDNQPVVWEFSADGNDRYYAGSSRRFLADQLANYIRVLGGNGDTATFMYDLVIDETNPIFAGNPYSTQRIGRYIWQYNNGNPSSILTSVDDCKFRAKYELMRRAGYDEGVSTTCFPIYFLEPDDVISIKDDEVGCNGKYMIQSLTIPISPSPMTIESLRQVRIIENWNFI